MLVSEGMRALIRCNRASVEKFIGAELFCEICKTRTIYAINTLVQKVYGSGETSETIENEQTYTF